MRLLTVLSIAAETSGFQVIVDCLALRFKQMLQYMVCMAARLVCAHLIRTLCHLGGCFLQLFSIGDIALITLYMTPVVMSCMQKFMLAGEKSMA